MATLPVYILIPAINLGDDTKRVEAELVASALAHLAVPWVDKSECMRELKADEARKRFSGHFQIE